MPNYEAYMVQFLRSICFPGQPQEQQQVDWQAPQQQAQGQAVPQQQAAQPQAQPQLAQQQ